MKGRSDAPVQIRIGIPEDDPYGPPEFPEPLDILCPGPNCPRQVLIQAEKGRLRARSRFELPIQQGEIFIPHVRIA